MFVMFVNAGIVGYLFLIHHDYFYGKPWLFVPLFSGVLHYIAFVRKVSKFLTWLCYNEVIH